VYGDHTAAGLPTRIPKANLFPGSMGGGPANGPSTGPMPAFGQPSGEYQTGGYQTGGYPSGGYQSPVGYDDPAVNYETESPTYPQPTGPRRSAEMARTRLSGFQLGSRDAQGRPPHAGED